MKRFVPMLLTGGLAASLAGCAEDPAAAPSTGSFAPPAVSAARAAGVLVSLSVPNMT